MKLFALPNNTETVVGVGVPIVPVRDPGMLVGVFLSKLPEEIFWSAE
jgi:hypothetical protein